LLQLALIRGDGDGVWNKVDWLHGVYNRLWLRGRRVRLARI
jgi:hypothetical protein